ncbi:MAG: undecaprenyl/decaprenyl-phosphate alpha-N-acetylglucosaminyl 1-phosphate transferase, partial [Alphaproteobacteria bacterium]|nr:undecaprenyl/decaprenyl-phosphate alpha-N-acetylglucosaminyl 1-phosphate transferase [Alphaproteobacteria bacterium]
MIWALLIFPFCAFLAVGVSLPLLRKVAPKFGLVDVPGGRKDHVGKVPLIGGIVIFPIFIALSIIQGDSVAEMWPLYTAIVLLMVTGAVDDLKHMPAYVKFVIQFVAATLIVIPGGA